MQPNLEPNRTNFQNSLNYHWPDPTAVRRCARCLYSESTPSITFDEAGVCNYCKMHDEFEKQYPIGSEGEKRLAALVDEIKAAGKGKKYDCVIGVSGGCDSSYLVYLSKKWGLRPLAAHFDNTWNSAISTENIRRVLQKLNVNLFTLVANNKEYDDIYRAFMLAGVPDIESPTDIALAATMYLACEKYGVKYILEGHSFRTEGISPLGWLYMDGKYIESVHDQFGRLKRKTYPNMTMASMLRWMAVRRIKKVRPLYFIDYQKEQAKAFLTKEFGWQWYGGHHLENRFTNFYHSYFVPRRMNIDFRVLGYAALVRSGQMLRGQGLSLLRQPTTTDPEIVDLVKTRIGFSDAEFQRIMTQPMKTYRDFRTYKKTFERLKPFFWLLAKFDLIPRSFYVKYTARST